MKDSKKQQERIDGSGEICERDFYPPKDDRMHWLGIDDVDGGDTYDEYLEYFWDNYENDIYD